MHRLIYRSGLEAAWQAPRRMGGGFRWRRGLQRYACEAVFDDAVACKGRWAWWRGLQRYQVIVARSHLRIERFTKDPTFPTFLCSNLCDHTPLYCNYPRFIARWFQQQVCSSIQIMVNEGMKLCSVSNPPIVQGWPHHKLCGGNYLIKLFCKLLRS